MRLPFNYSNQNSNFPDACSRTSADYHFAKLYLCSHAFRGVLKTGSHVQNMSSEVEEFANFAVLSAKAILRVLTTDPEMQACLDGLPSYFDTMIAFAVVFLLKLATIYSDTARTDREEIFATVDQVVVVLKGITSKMHRRHILVSIAAGVQKLLDRCRKSQQTLTDAPQTAAEHPTTLPLANSAPNGGNDWMISPSDSFILGDYDFLGQQDVMNGFDFAFDNWELQQVPPP